MVKNQRNTAISGSVHRDLWNTPANPEHPGLGDINPTGNSLDLAKKFASSPKRDVGELGRPFMTPVTAETLHRPTCYPRSDQDWRMAVAEVCYYGARAPLMSSSHGLVLSLPRRSK